LKANIFCFTANPNSGFVAFTIFRTVSYEFFCFVLVFFGHLKNSSRNNEAPRSPVKTGTPPQCWRAGPLRSDKLQGIRAKANKKAPKPNTPDPVH
jgi:hypothetical protein